jgi:glycosyltransferase involved in cell wall biosynthesis
MIINGRFLSASQTGVQRVAAQLLASLDQMLPASEISRWKLMHSSGSADPKLSRINDIVAGRTSGQAWEQLTLPLLARDDTVLSLCNTAPIFHPRNIVMFHDAQVFSSPASYSSAFRSWYRWMMPRVGRRALRVLTVSEFSREQLAGYGVAPKQNIEVIPNGCDHLINLIPDRSVVDRCGLADRPFVLALSSTQAHKNIGVLLSAFASPALHGLTLVLAGRAGGNDFEALNMHAPASVIFTGSVSDEQLVSLYAHASMFAFPSTTEGFGLPPLEAMSLGCPVVASRGGALPETCGEAPLYADANDPAEWVETLRRLASDPDLRATLEHRGRQRASLFTWRKSADRLLAAVESLGA